MAIAVSVVLGPRLFVAGGDTEGEGPVSVAAGVADLSVLSEPYGHTSGTGSTVILTPTDAASRFTPTTEAVEPLPAEPETQSTTTTAASSVTTVVSAPTTVTTEPPPPPTTTTTAAPPPPPTTTTTTAPPPAALAAKHGDGTQEGNVSWYDLPGAQAGVCAHRTIDKGTVVTVTNLQTGSSITCTVNDRGPYTNDGKILDLYRDDFARLAPLDQGVFPARLDW